MPFESTIQQMDAAQLDAIFAAAPPDTTPTADTLAVSSEEAETPTGGVKFGPTAQEEKIPFFDDSLLAPENEEEVSAATTPEAAAPEATEPETTTTEEVPTAENLTADDAALQNTVLKNTVNHLISIGQWADFDGREDMEITPEVYADLAAKQNQNLAYEIVNELVDSTGAYGKAIINHIKSGGNPDEIIDLFKEQKAIEQIDTSSEQGKQLKIEKYYSEVLGWKPEKVAKTVNRLIENNEIESEFADVEELYNKHYSERLAQTEAETKKLEQENKRKEVAFVTGIKTALEESTDLTTQEKKLIADSVLTFKHKLDNGKKVNDFYLKFAEMQADPKQYVELIHFVMDNNNYKKAIQKRAQSEANKQAFNFIKGNAAVNTPKNNDLHIAEDAKPGQKAPKGTNFSFAYNKR